MRIKLNCFTVRLIPETTDEKQALNYLGQNNTMILREIGASTKDFKALRIEPSPISMGLKNAINDALLQYTLALKNKKISKQFILAGNNRLRWILSTNFSTHVGREE